MRDDGLANNATDEFRHGMLFLAAALAIAAVITRIAGHSRQTEGTTQGSRVRPIRS